MLFKIIFQMDNLILESRKLIYLGFIIFTLIMILIIILTKNIKK
jgi:hypothetical protein